MHKVLASFSIIAYIIGVTKMFDALFFRMKPPIFFKGETLWNSAEQKNSFLQDV